MSNKFLSGPRLWAEIRRLASTKARPRMVAAAYVGANSTSVLHLRKGDSFHCALSLRNAKAGVVCPGELGPLRDNGVRIFANELLHAKIYLFGKTAIVGSCNTSKRSQGLDEAALLTTDKKIVAAVKKWFQERQDVEISTAFLKQCNTVYRPPRWNPFESPGMRSQGKTKQGSLRSLRLSREPDAERWWFLWNVYDVEYDEEEESLEEQAYEAATKRIPADRSAFLEPISWNGRRAYEEMKVGDKIVCTVPKGGGQAVQPWGTCHALKRRIGPDGNRNMIIMAEFPRSGVSMGFKRFVQRARAAGLPMALKGGSSYYDRPEHIQTLRLLSSEHSLRTTVK